MVKNYDINTVDGYGLTVHRLIHPEDIKRGGPIAGAKKPYILVHGLLGSSTSFVRNIKADYKPPERSFKIKDYFHDILKAKYDDDAQYQWSSVAAQYQAQHDGDKSMDIKSRSTARRLLDVRTSQDFSEFLLVNYDADKNEFAKDYRKAYHRTRMPTKVKDRITNSLAFTLSNFGYDVWLLNLRGNAYSRRSTEPLGPEYWNFGIQELASKDLQASIDLVRTESGYLDSIGLISYSYTSDIILNLLKSFPSHADLIRPVVLIAPGPLSAPPDYGVGRKIFQNAVKAITTHLGSFPSLGRNAKEGILLRTACSLPLAKRVCRVREMVLNGAVNSLKELVIPNDEVEILRQDGACGQTSTKTLRQIVDQLAAFHVHPNFAPYGPVKLRSKSPNKRTVMIIHSQTDAVSTPEDVRVLRESALKNMVLVDYIIKSPNFTHSSFLFSKRNQYLVNGEIIRMIGLFEYMDKASVPAYSPPGTNRAAIHQPSVIQSYISNNPQISASGPMRLAPGLMQAPRPVNIYGTPPIPQA